MRKLKLQVENIAVESFPTGDAQEPVGTVDARELRPTPPYVCPALTKPTDCPCTPVAAFEAATRPYICDPVTVPPRCD
jgi:hypothetical protein